MVLRQEVYELDLDDLVAEAPRQTPVRLFSVAVRNCRIQRLQARGENLHSVFLVTESEALSYQYELPLPTDNSQLHPDPRISHTLNLRADQQGHSLQAVVVGYGRVRPGHYPDIPRPDLIAEVQSEVHVAYQEARYTDDVVLPAQARVDSPIRHHRQRLPWETLTYELKGIASGDPAYFSPADFLTCDLSDVYGHGDDETPPPTAVQFKLSPFG